MTSAVISPCGKYRYRLDRDMAGFPWPGVGPEPKVFAFFGVNPSTADASLDDATVRKWRGFTIRNGGSKFIVGNVFSYRATDVKVLGQLVDSVPLRGDDHHKYIHEIIAEADVLVPCWGGLAKMPKILRAYPSSLMGLLLKSGKPILHFGVTGCGQPKHPLMLGYDTPLTPWVTQ